jgi:putative hemolysin
VAPDVLSALHNDVSRAAYIRACCYTLGRKAEPAARRPVPVAAPGAREALRDEVASLRKHILADEGNFQVFPVRGDAAPRILHEIGRLREKTFRAAQEGSGNAVDIDRFDPHYTHLVLWNKDAQAIAGSYRVRIFSPGATQDSLKKTYTASLFRFQPGFFERCGTAMELGRAFVVWEYQRDYAPLLMLWKGIARLAVRSGVRTLFGACSIGLGYAPESIHMLRRCLEEYHFAPDLAGLAQGRRPPAPFPGPNEPHARGLDYKLLNRAVKNLEGGKGLPILFKHYLNLGGRIAAFHEDASFGTLDALTVVDLAAIPEKTLAWYLGRE